LDFQTLKTFPVLQLAYQLSQEVGASIYLVGGAVRDILMGLFYGKDFDFVMGDQWQEAVRLFAHKTRGTVIPWDINQMRIVIREAGETVTVDFARLRGADITGDLRERDFTINSMALSVASLFQEDSPEIHDPLGGRVHLQKKVLQADGNAAFDQDPLRILRAIRFSRALNFRIEDTTKSLMLGKARLLTTVARERVKSELFAILNLPGADHAIQELAGLNIMHYLLPELQQVPAVQQGLRKYSLPTVECLASMLDHPERISEQYAAGIQEYLHEYIEDGVITRRALLLCAGLLCDRAALSANSAADDGSASVPSREQDSRRINQATSRQLLLGRKAQRVLDTIAAHYARILKLAELEEVPATAAGRMVYDMEEAPLEVLLLALADTQARRPAKQSAAGESRVRRLAEKIMEIVFSSSAANSYRPLITGEDVMDAMNLPPGEAVGKILREIHDGERSGMFNSREEVMEWLKKKKKSVSSS
jgi:poly(A) polymerase